MYSQVTQKPSQQLFFANEADIQFSIFTETDIDEVANCLAESFTQGEPMTKEMQVTADEFKVFAHHICKKAAAFKLSVIARDKANNKLIGCRIVEPASKMDEGEMPSLSDKFNPIFALLDEASKPLKANADIEHTIHFVTLAVDKAYQSRGIAKKLLVMQMHFLSQTNYQFFQGEFTNPRSYSAIKGILTEMDASIKINYADFIYENSKPFARLSGEAVGCLGMVAKLLPEHKAWASQQEIQFPHQHLKKREPACGNI